MNLRQLRYFVTVAEERHFGRAARRLHVSQPPLSQQVKALEEELGCILLERTTRRVELTPAGEAFLDRARSILDDVRSAAEHAQQVQAGVAGRLRLSFVGSATYDLLPRLVRMVRRNLPQIVLGIESEQLTPGQVDGLIAQRIDLAVLGLASEAAPSDTIQIHSQRRVPLGVVMAREHRLARTRTVAFEDLKKERFLMHPAGGQSLLHQKVRSLCHKAGFQPIVGQEVRETGTAVSLAASGLGLAILPASVRALRVVGAVYRPLAEKEAYMIRAVATRRDDPSPALAKAVQFAGRSFEAP